MKEFYAYCNTKVPIKFVKVELCADSVMSN